MALKRVLEPEIMDDGRYAREYGEIDRSRVNMEFAGILADELNFKRGKIVDLGTGPCDLPLAICRRIQGARMTAVEMSPVMLKAAAGKIAGSGLSLRIRLLRADAKNTGLPCGSFDFAVCNNLVHHIAEPGLLFREIARLLRHGGGIFIRDLRRPRTARELAAHMANCSGDTPRQRELLRDSLLAALRPEEVAEFVKGAGLRGVVLAEAGDRHWELRRPAR